jgi:hypothetical protein
VSRPCGGGDAARTIQYNTIQYTTKGEKNEKISSKNHAYKLSNERKYKPEELIEIWNINRGQKDEAPIILNRAIYEKISCAFEHIPDIKDWRKMIEFGVKDNFWKNTINWSWLISPEKIEQRNQLREKAFEHFNKTKRKKERVF